MNNEYQANECRKQDCPTPVYVVNPGIRRPRLRKSTLGRRVRSLAAGVALFAAMLAQCAVPSFPNGFVSVGEAVPDAILEIRYYSTYNFTGERIDGYEEPVAILTKEAAQALKAASDEAMRRGYRLKIYDAYRPQRAVAHFMRWAKDLADVRMKACFYPNLDKSVLFAQGYIAEKSGHSRGSTVDLTLFDMASGKELDMGGTFDFFGEESHPDWRGVTEAQFANRMTLRAIMTAHGFRPLAEEWWHFTLANEPYPDTYFDFPVAQAENTDANNASMDDMIVRIAEIEVYPEWLAKYLDAARTVGAESVAKEPGVVCIFPMQKAANPCSFRIVEIYRDEAAYKAHLETPHFRDYKDGTPHMIKSLDLVAMQPLDKDHMNLIFKRESTQ